MSLDIQANKLVIWSDADLLVVDKPAGLLSLPDGYDHSQPYLGRVLEPLYRRLWTVHRLDRETSGVIVLARNAQAHQVLNDQFANRQVSKVYHALIGDVPSWDEKRVDLPLRTNVGRRHRTAVDDQSGKPASTNFKVLERFDAGALLEIRPETGRTHQIRAHLFALGVAILSDPLYGIAERSPWIDRLALHALGLQLWHPRSGEMLRFEIPYPPDFEKALTALRQ